MDGRSAADLLAAMRYLSEAYAGYHWNKLHGINLDIGLFFTTMKQLRKQLEDEAQMNRLRENAWTKRELFTFDYHADRLVEFFRRAIQVSSE